MNDEADRREDEEAALLAAHDEALAAGDPGAALTVELPADLQGRLAVLQRLNRLRGHASPEPTADAALARVGPYEVRGELGRGAFGVVYRAHDPRAGRDVALKVPHP